MARGKKIRTRGKVPLSRQFQSLKEGDSVAVVREISLNSNFPRRIQGRTGVVASKRGSAYVIDLNDNGKDKQFIIQPVHLKRLQTRAGDKKK